MKCPITYKEIKSNRKTSPLYSLKGLRYLDKKLNALYVFNYTQKDQLIEIQNKENKISISGQQPKLLVNLNLQTQQFEIARQGGQFILKPQNPRWPQLPENEDLTMKLARTIGLVVPIHGLLHCKGGQFAYFIKRFDRVSDRKMPVEDFAQLQDKSRDEKYDSSMERVAKTINFCRFPVVEKRELFKRVLFCYLTGNQDMHLKNFSLITRDEGFVQLSPGYDFLNTTIVNPGDQEEIALPLNGKQNNLNKKDLITYYGGEKLQLSEKAIKGVLSEFSKKQDEWKDLIRRSFLSDDLKEDYQQIVVERSAKLGIET